MSETETRWLIVGGLALLAFAYVAIMRYSERRRSEHFALLAAHCASSVEEEGESSQLFRVQIGDRELEVRDAYRGGEIGSSSSGSRYVTIATKLRGRGWDLHSVSIRLRLGRAADQPFEKAFKVEQFGLPMRESWLTPAVRSALAASLAAGHRLGSINIEGGELIYREIGSPRNFSPEALAVLLDRHAELAPEIERVL